MALKDIVSKRTLPIVLLILASGTAAAAVAVAYLSASTLELGATPAPVVYEPGADSGAAPFVSSFAVSANGTTFTAAIRGVPAASVSIDELFRVRNVDSRPHTVVLTAERVANPQVVAYRIDFYDGATLAGTMDLKSASPGVTFVDLAPGKVLSARTTVVLAPGAGAGRVGEARPISMLVS